MLIKWSNVLNVGTKGEWEMVNDYLETKYPLVKGSFVQSIQFLAPVPSTIYWGLGFGHFFMIYMYAICTAMVPWHGHGHRHRYGDRGYDIAVSKVYDMDMDTCLKIFFR